MAVNVYLLGLETSYDVMSDPQYRCTIIVKEQITGDVHTATAGCTGLPEDCPEEIALENEWEIIDH